MAISGHKIKHIVLKGHTLFKGVHCDKAKSLEVIESDAKQLRDDGRLHQTEDGSSAIFDTEKEAEALIQKLGWKPEVYKADQKAPAKA